MIFHLIWNQMCPIEISWSHWLLKFSGAYRIQHWMTSNPWDFWLDLWSGVFSRGLLKFFLESEVIGYQRSRGLWDSAGNLMDSMGFFTWFGISWVQLRFVEVFPRTRGRSVGNLIEVSREPHWAFEIYCLIWDCMESIEIVWRLLRFCIDSNQIFGISHSFWDYLWRRFVKILPIIWGHSKYRGL